MWILPCRTKFVWIFFLLSISGGQGATLEQTPWWTVPETASDKKRIGINQERYGRNVTQRKAGEGNDFPSKISKVGGHTFRQLTVLVVSVVARLQNVKWQQLGALGTGKMEKSSTLITRILKIGALQSWLKKMCSPLSLQHGEAVQGHRSISFKSISFILLLMCFPVQQIFFDILPSSMYSFILEILQAHQGHISRAAVLIMFGFIP